MKVLPIGSSVPRILLGATLPVAFAVADSYAQAPSDAAMAQRLFDEGRELMANSRYREACQKFSESQRLDAGGGTLLNLAICHEKEGKTATAWHEFEEALALATKDGRADRQRTARQHLSSLSPQLSQLTVKLASSTADIPGLEVRVDQTLRSPATYGVPALVDPGWHDITATAPGHQSWSSRLEIGPTADSKSIEVPPLVALAAIPATAGPSQDRVLGYLLGGAGAALLGVGTYFGMRAVSLRNDSENLGCSDRTCPTQPGVDAWQDAKSAALLSDIGLGLGLAALGVGTYFVWHATKDGAPAPSPRAGVTASTGPRGGFVTVNGRF